MQEQLKLLQGQYAEVKKELEQLREQFAAVVQSLQEK